jgi:uncharacterized protein YndB with AHSA1/START domain
MIPQKQETAVQQQVVVEVPIKQAFKIFIEKFDLIKPREHNMLAVEIAETVFEARVGGSIYDRGVDGSICRFARVLAYEPPHRVVFSWDIDPQWQIETDPNRTSEGASFPKLCTAGVRSNPQHCPVRVDLALMAADMLLRYRAARSSIS